MTTTKALRYLRMALAVALASAALAASHRASAAESRCFGGVANGRLENGVRLPLSGPNFSSYSTIAVAAGRTHVHSRVASVVEASYAALARTHPERRFVYGETGWASGGRFAPHRTHQNGLSVDFFVPVRDARGRSVPLPTHPANRAGYDIEFDDAGRFGEYTIDFEAIADHLHALHAAARAAGIGLALVILEPVYLPKLFATSRGAALRDTLPFMRGKAWVRHDEHYHVDFAVPCLPMTSRK